MPCSKGPKGITLDALSYACNLLCELLHVSKGLPPLSCCTRQTVFRWAFGASTFCLVPLDFSFPICKVGLLIPPSEGHGEDALILNT